MNKVKSAVCLTLISILIAGLIFMCAAMFSYGQAGQLRYNSILSMTDKDAQYGGLTYEENAKAGEAADQEAYYRGGGYYAVLYPDGVLTEKEYNDDLAAYQDEDKREEFEKGYKKVGSLYFDSDFVDGSGNLLDDFKNNFDNALEQMRTRVASLETANARIDRFGDFGVQVYLPSVSAREESSTLLSVFQAVSRIGEFSVSCGASESAAVAIPQEDLREYVSGVNPYVVGEAALITVDFTQKGFDEWLAPQTATAAETSVTLYFKIGDTQVGAVSVSDAATGRTVQFGKSSSAAFAPAEARALASAMRTAMSNPDNDLTFSVNSYTFQKAQFGDLALTLLYVAFAVLSLGMLVFFFVRYRGLAVAHLYSFLIYVLLMIVLVWAIPFLNLNAWTVIAVAFGGLLLSLCDAISYESARKEYALGKTMASSVKTGYKKCFWLIFDVHVAVALFGFVTYFIALTQLSVFAFTLGLAAVLSGLCSLAVNRFHWAMLMTFTKKPGAFCNFKREEVSDDE